MKFVDDQVNMETVNMRKAKLLVEEGAFFKDVVPVGTERLLEHITTNAEGKGMKINEKKTSLMLVSAATSFDSRARITLRDETVRGSKSMKILGVCLDSDFSFRSHIKTLRSRLRAKTWALLKLRKAGLSVDKLVRTY